MNSRNGRNQAKRGSHERATTPVQQAPGPQRVAIIGGGCAAMAAAFELSRPELGGRFALTIYQQGWRLGGKGASGRGQADRIEEHGLHIWLGFYENAFRLMRDCYAEARRDPSTCPITTWQQAFTPHPQVGVADWSVCDGWQPWMAAFPATAGAPGDPSELGTPLSVASYLARMVQCLITLLRHAQVPGGGPTTPHRSPLPSRVKREIQRLLRVGGLSTMALILEALRTLETAFTFVAALQPFPTRPVLRLLDALSSGVVAVIGSLNAGDAAQRRVWEVIDLVLAITRGCVREGLMFSPTGFDVLDEYDCREWMRRHGASESSINGAFVRGLYDMAFAYEDGDKTRPRIAAGQAIRGALRFFFTYRGHFFWKMQAGMGDVVFAPLYEVLKQRGVRFEFFHRLENVGIAAPADGSDSPHVRSLLFDVQAEVTGKEYDPLIDVRGLPCWPAEPDYAQLRSGQRLRREAREFESHWDRRREGERELLVGRDFDFVVLGVGIGAIPTVCKEILARDARWRDMVRHVKTVSTQALQLWTRAGMSELGWKHGPLTMSAFVKPFDTWADMQHLLPAESWGAAHGRSEPHGIAYFCNVLPDPPSIPDRPESGDHTSYPDARREEVWDNAAWFLSHQVHHLWPDARDERGRFRWDLLVDAREEPGNASAGGSARLRSQWASANVSPTERYTLSLPGSTKFRISPLDNSYDNLTLAGDWTNCGFNEGCVEAAVMSGLLAAHALSGFPRLEDIVGYDHP